jgi:hypothetical protein
MNEHQIKNHRDAVERALLPPQARPALMVLADVAAGIIKNLAGSPDKVEQTLAVFINNITVAASTQVPVFEEIKEGE